MSASKRGQRRSKARKTKQGLHTSVPARQSPDGSPPHAPNKNVQAVRYQQSVEMFEGPLPHPDLLQKYDSVIPGFAERIIAQWEQQSTHRQRLESTVVLGGVQAQAKGQWMALVVAVVGLLVAGAVGIWGNPIAGTVIAAVDLASLAGVFLYGRWSQVAERERKSD